MITTIKEKFEWTIFGTYSGKGWGWTKTADAAKKAADARLRKLKKSQPNNGTSYSIRIYKSKYTVTHKVESEIIKW